MLIYKESFVYNDPLNIVFLCGNKYTPNDPREKRIVLKEFLETSITNCRAIILEENFIFGRTNMQYLAYDDIFLSGLAEIEQLASLYADKIIIIHETVSTAAELGMFAINPRLSKKICLIIPDDISIEERKVSNFIQLAFMNGKSPKTKIGNKFVYYPDVEVNRISVDKSDYCTYFHNNKIGEKLGEKIISFAKKGKVAKSIKVAKCSYGKPSTDLETVSYYVDEKNQIINVFINIDVLKIQLLALFFVEDYRTEFRKTKEIKDHVGFICCKYEEILLNTIAEIEGLNSQNYSLKTNFKDTNICKLRQAVGYYLYMLQAIGWIGLEQNESLNPSQRKIRISMEMDGHKKYFKDLLFTKRTTEFGRLKI